MSKATQHNHGANFGRKVDGCPRCTELKLGAPVRQWGGYSNNDRQRTAEVRAHNCIDSRCGVVCTFGDY